MPRKRTALLAAVAAAAVAAAAMVMLTARDKTIAAESVVATVDGVPIAYGEYAIMLAANRAKTAGYFQAAYGSGSNFWTSEIDGEVPLDRLKREALADAVETKISQMMAQDMGLAEDISYEAFRREFLAENRRRAETAASGGILIGPERYEEAQYYALVHSERVGRMQNLFRTEVSIAEAEALRYYHANKPLYKRPDSIALEIVSVEGEDGGEILEAVMAGIDAGQDLNLAVEPYRDRVAVTARLLNAETARSDALSDPELLARALELEAGRTSAVFRSNGRYMVLLCVEREDGGYRPFEEVEKAIRSHLAGQAYIREFERRVREAKVIVNEAVYDRIGVNDIGLK